MPLAAWLCCGCAEGMEGIVFARVVEAAYSWPGIGGVGMSP